MGQYYLICNLDKRQYLCPHSFGDGAKLMEFGGSGSGTMLGLAVLLSSGNGRGGGDLSATDSLIGSWAGDRIVIVGDYDDTGKFMNPVQITEGGKNTNLYGYAGKYFEDISYKVIAVLARDDWARQQIISKCFTNHSELAKALGTTEAALKKVQKRLQERDEAARLEDAKRLIAAEAK